MEAGQLVGALAPMLLVSVGYIDPGKWVCAVEYGSRLGNNLMPCLILFNLFGILCYFLSAYVTVITGRNLAQESSKFKVLVVYLAGLTFGCYVIGMLISLPKFSFTKTDSPLKSSGENSFALMSLLGANFMPHCFYLHSSIVQRYQPPVVSKHAWYQHNLIVTITLSGGIFLVTYALMNSATDAFYNTGLAIYTFQDSISLVNQAFKNPVLSFASFVILVIANQITTLSWEFCAEGRETITYEFFKMDLMVGIHHAIVRLIAVVPPLYSLGHSGAEGMYHMLMCSQIILALILPSSVLPLFRIALSKTTMGLFKLSPIQELIVAIAFLGMLGLEFIFFVEMIFGESDLVENFRWSMKTTTSIPYILLLCTACASLCFMLWLAASPLKPLSKKVFPTSREKPLRNHPDMATKGYNDNLPDVTTIKENMVVNLPVSLSRDEPGPEDSITTVKSISFSRMVSKTCDVTSFATSRVKSEINKRDDSERAHVTSFATSRVKSEINERDDSERITPKDTPEVGPFGIQEGHAPFRNHSRKNYENGNNNGNVSKLSALGRGARRQFTAVLIEFWEQMYDLHGQTTNEAKAKKLELLLLHGTDSKPSQSLTREYFSEKDLGKQFYPSGLRVPRVPDTPKKLKMFDAASLENLREYIELAKRFPGASDSIWENPTPLLEKYRHDIRMADANYGKIQSLPNLQSYDAFVYKSVMVHGYQIASCLNRIAIDRSDNHNGELGSSLQGNNFVKSVQHHYDPYSPAHVENTESQNTKKHDSLSHFERELLQSFKICIVKLLKLEESEWLFRSNGGVDEDLIDMVARKERQNLDSSVPQCGEGCVWKVDLIVSFGVWCIHRILELSLLENRPELWGKYTYVLNHLQGIINLAFFKRRTPVSACFCVRSTSLASGKVTTAKTLLDIIKEIEIALPARKGKSATRAGDVAFRRGKENLCSVLKRYRRRLSGQSVQNNEKCAGSRKLEL